MKTQSTNIPLTSAFLALLVLIFTMTGCGGGGGGGGTGSSSNSGGGTGQGGDPAPASIGGKTFNGHIGGTATTWQIVFTGGSGSGGAYSYSENGRHLDSGTFTYNKTASNAATVTLSDGTTLQFTFTSSVAGTYLVPNLNPQETGTFTTN